MASFRPKRQWKPKRRDRNVARRKKRKRWWRRNRNAIKMQRRRRYRVLRNNSLFKAWRKKRIKEKAKRRMRFADVRPQLPESWFVFYDEAGPGQLPDVALGYIVDYDPDSEELLVYDVDEEGEKIVGIDDFLRQSEFLEEADLDNFDLLMDQYYGDASDDLDLVPESEMAPTDLDELRRGQEIIDRIFGGAEWFRGSGIAPAPDGDGLVMSVRVAPGHGARVTEALSLLEDFPGDYEVVEMDRPETRVASMWFRKVAFNKENPADLLSQLLKVIERASSELEGRGQQRLVDVASRLRGMNRDVQEAWRRRREE